MYTAEKQKCPSDISSLLDFSRSLAPLGPSGQTSGGSANRVGDVRPHHQGVEGIGFPWFPHLRPTEARERCEQCCLSVPVCFFSSPQSLVHSVSYSRTFFFFSLFTQSFMYTQALLIPPFYALLPFSLFLSWSLCFLLLLVSQTLSHAGVAAML